MAHQSWIGRLGTLLVLMLVTAGVAYAVALTAVDDTRSEDVTAPLPPIAQDQRPTVQIADASIVPVVSASATVAVLEDGNYLQAPATSDDLAYQLLDPPVGVKALINGGPSGFDCAWSGLFPPDGQSPAQGSAEFQSIAPGVPGVMMRCRIPDDIRVVGGMNGTMVLQMGQMVTAQSLPVSAVVGNAVQGQVIVIEEDGSAEIRTVQLGIADTFNIEIVSGLDPSEKVLLTPTQYDLTHNETQS